MPKTAGKSFAVSLKEYFRGSLMEDYGDAPINSPRDERLRKLLASAADNVGKPAGNFRCIHGHFMPFKYFPLLDSDKENVDFVTWLREPFDRMRSHYNFGNQAMTHCLRKHYTDALSKITGVFIGFVSAMK